MSLAALIRDMSAAGAPPEAIALAVEAIEAAQAEVAAGRVKARDKKRAQRAAARDREGTVPGQSQDSPRTVPDAAPAPSSPNENNLTPSTHTPEKQTPARTKTGHRLPVGWEPRPLDGDTAEAVLRWPPGALERELARFRDWAASATGTNARKSDWQAAWRNWVRKADDEGRYGNGQRDGTNQLRERGSASGFGRTVDAFADFVGEASAH